MSVLAQLAKILRNGRDVWLGPDLVDEVRADGSALDTAVPTEKAVRDAIGAGGGGGGTTVHSVAGGRLTLASGTPVTAVDQAAKTTLYYALYSGNQIGLYSGSVWVVRTFAETSLSLSGYAADTNYDIWAYDNSGTLAIESTAWTNDTTRATALALQDGVYVKSGDATRRYLGTIRITGTSGQCEDSEAKRFVWNYYNRTGRTLLTEGVYSHSYTDTGTIRAWNNNSSYAVHYVCGVQEDPISVQIFGDYARSGGTPMVGVGLDTTSAFTSRLGYSAGQVTVQNYGGAGGAVFGGIGKHSLYAVQRGNAAFIAFSISCVLKG